MLLTDLLDLALARKDLPVCDGTKNNWYIPAIADYRDCLGAEPAIEHLCRDCINAWLDKRVSQNKLSCYTIKSRRGAILAIWRAAVEMDLIDSFPTKIRKLKLRRKNPTAWDRDEVQRLFLYALYGQDDKKMQKTHLSQRLFFASLIAAGYDTAMRLGDLLSLERDWIRTDKSGAGWLSIEQSKTGIMVSCRINPSTMILIDRLYADNPNRRLIWPLGVRRESLYRQIRAIVKESGIRCGTFRFLRRASATHIEMRAPGTSFRHAGHSDPATTRRFYLDAEQLNGAVSPEPLEVVDPSSKGIVLGSSQSFPLPSPAGTIK